MEASVETYLSMQKALKAVMCEGQGNQLGWVMVERSEEDEEARCWFDNASRDWQTACKKQCEDLGVNFETVQHHLKRTTELAKVIGEGETSFCYGAVHRFLEHDIKHAKLLLRPVCMVAASNKRKVS